MPPEAALAAEGIGGSPRRKGFRLWRTAGALAGAACVGVALYAATPLLRPSDSDEGTLRGLQVRVLNISQAAAENRMDGALAALDALEKDLDAAAGQGLISLSRYRGIEAAVEDVRADVSRELAAVTAAAAEVPAATTSEASTSGASTLDTSTAAVPADPPAEPQQAPQVAPEQPAIVPVPAPAPIQQEPVLPDPAKEAKGKGKGKP
jgi:hypothetical protein